MIRSVQHAIAQAAAYDDIAAQPMRSTLAMRATQHKGSPMPDVCREHQEGAQSRHARRRINVLSGGRSSSWIGRSARRARARAAARPCAGFPPRRARARTPTSHEAASAGEAARCGLHGGAVMAPKQVRARLWGRCVEAAPEGQPGIRPFARNGSTRVARPFLMPRAALNNSLYDDPSGHEEVGGGGEPARVEDDV